MLTVALIIGAVTVCALVFAWNLAITNPESRYERWKRRHFKDLDL